jgi:hypothetical protein
MMKHWSEELERYGPCLSALKWARRQPSYVVAWKKCQIPAWLAFCLNGFSPEVSELYDGLVVGPDGPNPIQLENSHSPVAVGESQRSKKRCDWIRANHKRPALRKLKDSDRGVSSASL